MKEILNIVSAVLLIITSILLILIIAMQESRQSGMSGAISGGGSDSYFGKNRARALDSRLVRMTKIFAAVFFVLTLAVSIVESFTA